MKLVAVALGGAAGAVVRFGITSLSAGWLMVRFPVGTLLVNLTGSFIIGVLWGLGMKQSFSPVMTAFLFPGLLGGYTTFSAFSLECLQLLRAGHWGQALVYLLVSVLGGVLFAYAGLRLSGNTLLG